MLGKEIIMRELTAIDLDVDNYEQVFEIMGARFLEKGYVNEEYLPTIKEREAQYPTALPVEPYPIAIPLTMATAIIKPFIAPVRLKNTVEWGRHVRS
jgi:PTS system galactitol-specific IIA component